MRRLACTARATARRCASIPGSPKRIASKWAVVSGQDVQTAKGASATRAWAMVTVSRWSLRSMWSRVHGVRSLLHHRHHHHRPRLRRRRRRLLRHCRHCHHLHRPHLHRSHYHRLRLCRLLHLPRRPRRLRLSPPRPLDASSPMLAIRPQQRAPSANTARCRYASAALHSTWDMEPVTHTQRTKNTSPRSTTTTARRTVPWRSAQSVNNALMQCSSASGRR